MRRFFLIVLCTAALAHVSRAGVTVVRRGPLAKEDADLIRHFIRKAWLYGKRNIRLEEIPLELKTAERILNRRSKPHSRKLARAYLEAAQGYLFYFTYPKKKKESFLILAELCLRSALGLDASLYGDAYRYLIAMKKPRASLYYARNNVKKLERLRRELLSMRESTGEVVFRKKVLQWKERERKRAIRKKEALFGMMESRFLYGLKQYRTAFNRNSVTVWRPFLDIINNILDKTPRPPGGTYFLHQLMVKHHCRKEVMEVLGRRKIR